MKTPSQPISPSRGERALKEIEYCLQTFDFHKELTGNLPLFNGVHP